MLGYRPIVSPRLAVSSRFTGLVLFAGIATGLIISTIFLLTQGMALSDLYSQFLVYTFANPEGLDQTLTRSIPIILMGLSVAVCLRVKFWNIGAQGQVWVGAMGATAVSFYGIGPAGLRIETMFLFAMIAGGFWCGICAVARLYLRANEVVTTLLMNYVGALLAQQLLYGAWRNPTDSYPVSPTFAPGETLALLGFGHVHAGIFISLAAAAFCFWLCTFSRIGIMSDAVATNPLAARAVGIPVGRIVILMATLGGALSGLAGFTIVCGEEHKLTQFIGDPDFIFKSIVVAYLARSNPIGVIVAAVIVAGLDTAGDSLKAFYQLPGATILAIEATLLLCVSCFEFMLRYRLTWVKIPKVVKA
jgi:simple sugar transport system permease protein